jgi:NADH-ubiquinone oxidoreductase chain 4
MIVLLGIGGILFSRGACALQRDGKSLVAYSSVCHINFMVVVLLTYSPLGKRGRFIMMLSHGVTARILFWVVGTLFHVVGRRRVFCLRGALGLGGGIRFAVWGVRFSNFGGPPFLRITQELVFVLSVLSSW